MGYLISTILRILPILVSSLLIPTTFSADPLYVSCAKNSTDHNATTYAESINDSLSGLISEPPKTRFLNSSSSKQYHIQIFSFALCRGDVPVEDCGACLHNASEQIQKSCPHSLEAVIWYDYCHLKYSDRNFLGEVDTQFRAYLWNTKNQESPRQFHATVKNTLLDISKQVNEKSKWFARSDIKLSKNGSAKLYTMAQCTWDLSVDDCHKCLADAVEKLPGFSSKAKGENYTVPRGARTLTPNCIVRYETYGLLFYTY